MVLPPWHIVSPTGVIHVVRDEAALKTLAAQEPELVVRRENLLVRLHVVDPKNKKRLEGLPVHQKHWQLLQRVVWLQRVDDSTVLLPIIGGDGSFYVDNFCGSHRREDSEFFDGPRLQHFMKHGWVWSTTKSYEYAQRYTSYRWRRVDAGFLPSDPEGHGLLYQQSGPFALISAAPSPNPPSAAARSAAPSSAALSSAALPSAAPSSTAPSSAAPHSATPHSAMLHSSLPLLRCTPFTAADTGEPMEVEGTGIEPIELNFLDAAASEPTATTQVRSQSA